MYKSKLQEICHQRHWPLPTYSSAKDGPDHQPRFKGSVLVNGRTFECPNFSKSSKEAQNEAARIAFQHFSPLFSTNFFPAQNEAARIDFNQVALPSSAASSSVSSSAPPVSCSTGSSSASTSNLPNCNGILLRKNEDLSKIHHSLENTSSVKDEEFTGSSSASTSNIPDCNATLLRKNEESSKNNYSHGSAPSAKNDEFGDAQCVCKSLLQNYCQKRSWSLPLYSSIREGSGHAPFFKAKVSVEGQTFESPEFFRTLKEAEHSAAKVALFSFTRGDNQEDDYTPYKNLLQVLTQKEGFKNPVYTSNSSGASHVPTFTSTVEVDGKIFHGKVAKTKKQAEMLAAKVAYLSLKERQQSTPCSPLSLFCGEQKALECSYSNLDSTLTAELQTKLNIGCSSKSASAQGCHDSKDGDQEADSAERITNRGEAIASHRSPSATSQTGFERLAVTVPSVSLKLRGSPSDHLQVTVPSVSPKGLCSQSPTPVQQCPDPLIAETDADLPTKTTKITCKRVVVYPKKQYMKIQDQKGITVLSISDDDWVAVSMDY